MSTTIDTLKRAISLAEQIEKLQSELNQVLGGIGSGNGLQAKPVQAAKTPTTKPGPKKGGMSAAGRAAIQAAQKARWAKVKAVKGGSAPAKPAATSEAPKKKGKRTFSPEARAKMAAAAKKRWAKKK
jgi:hypothetical protein